MNVGVAIALRHAGKLVDVVKLTRHRQMGDKVKGRRDRRNGQN